MRQRPSDPGNRILWWGAASLVLLILSGVYFIFDTPPSFPLRTADAAEILAAHPARLLFFRFRPDPDVIVLDFPSLREQGRMLNRITALIEKEGMPRDRVLRDGELAATIRASGATPETYASRHAYPASALVRFFRLMAEDRVAPNREESKLRTLLGALHWFMPGAIGALIALPGALPGPGHLPGPDPSGRADLLFRALASAAYFVSPAYAAYAQHFFHDVLTPGEQALFRCFLASRGEDTDLTALVVNETQAALLFPPPGIGLAPGRLEALRARYWQGIPLGWLKRSVPNPEVATEAGR